MTAPRRIEISPFPGHKKLAVTTSWDDGTVHDRRVVKAFNEWGLKGTFNLNSGTLSRTGVIDPNATSGNIDASEVASLFAGHEVAIHSVTHPFLDRLEPSQVVSEVLEDRKALEDLVGYPVRGMAYPFGTYNQMVLDALRGLGIVYCRTVRDVERCFPPKEPLAWETMYHQFNPQIVPKFNAAIQNRWLNGHVFFIWGHSYEFQTANDWDCLERSFKPISGHPDVWYCTNIELFDYEAARHRVAIAANKRSAYNPNGIPMTINVDGKIIEIGPGKTIGL